MFDSGYYKALHSNNMELIADDVVTHAKGNKVYTKNGREVKADVIVLATGFRVMDFLFPLKIYNDEGVQLQDQLNRNGVKNFQSTAVSGFPNFVSLLDTSFSSRSNGTTQPYFSFDSSG